MSRSAPYSSASRPGASRLAENPSNHRPSNIDPQCNLIVNYLPLSVTDESLRELFGSIGVVKSSKVMRNPATKQSLAYGFVEYADKSTAEQAILEFNGKLVDNKTIKVAFAEKTKEEGDDDGTNLYVSGLPLNVNDESLREYFEPFGEIRTVKVMLNQVGESRGVGFVKFYDLLDAEAAISGMSGRQLSDDTDPIHVKVAMPPKLPQERKRERLLKNQKITHTNVAVSSLLTNSTGGFGQDSGLAALLNQATPQKADASSAHIPADLGRLLTPLLAAQTSRLASQLPVVVNNTSVVPSTGHVSVITGDVASLFVHGLPSTCDVRMLYELFSPFGAVLNVKPILDLEKEEHSCKGYGFVNFRKLEEARHAVIAMNGYVYEGRQLQVSFKEQTSGAGADLRGNIGQATNFGQLNVQLNGGLVEDLRRQWSSQQ